MSRTEPTEVDQGTLDVIYEQASLWAIEQQGQTADGAGAYASWYCYTQQTTGQPVDQ